MPSAARSRIKEGRDVRHSGPPPPEISYSTAVTQNFEHTVNTRSLILHTSLE